MCNLRWLTIVLAGALGAGALAQERAVEPVPVDGDFRRESNTDAVVLMLADQLGKSETEARDASAKLSQIGKRAVPVLSDLLERGASPQVKYHAAVALSRIRHPSAAQALFPMLTAQDTPREMRLLAIEAAAGSGLDQATAPLAAMADSEEDAELKLKALQALSVMPAAWRDCERLFVKTLQDPNEEIRLLGIQVCFYAAAVKIVYGAAEPALLELAERDPSTTVRCRSLRALARMKSGRSVALCARLLEDSTQPRDVARQAVSSIQTVTEVPLQDAAAVKRWWEKHGQARYANAPALQPFTLPRTQGKNADAGPGGEAADKTAPGAAQAVKTEALVAAPPASEPPATEPATAKKDAAGSPAEATRTAVDARQPASAVVSEESAVKPPAVRAQGRPLLEDTDENRPLSGVPIR